MAKLTPAERSHLREASQRCTASMYGWPLGTTEGMMRERFPRGDPSYFLFFWNTSPRNDSQQTSIQNLQCEDFSFCIGVANCRLSVFASHFKTIPALCFILLICLYVSIEINSKHCTGSFYRSKFLYLKISAIFSLCKFGQ